MSSNSNSRYGGGLPSLSPQPARTENEVFEEVLMITLRQESNDLDTISVEFSGKGFDVDNDEIIIDILKTALRSYGIES